MATLNDGAEIAGALRATLSTPAERDVNGRPLNVADALLAIAEQLQRIAKELSFLNAYGLDIGKGKEDAP